MAKHLNSNLVFFWRDGALVGLGDGCGQRYAAAAKGRMMMEDSPYGAWAKGTDDAWERALYGTPFTRDQFEAVIKPNKKLIGFSDAFYPFPDGYIETAGIDRTQPEFKDGRITLKTKKGKDMEVILHRVNHNPEYSRKLITDMVIHPGSSVNDHLTLQLAERFRIPIVFTMTPDTFKKYQAGEKVEGRRFFGHVMY